jgi:vacuolar protein sorting-associated protein 45
MYNLHTALGNYLHFLLSGSENKILFLDSYTTHVINNILSFSKIMKYNVLSIHSIESLGVNSSIPNGKYDIICIINNKSIDYLQILLQYKKHNGNIKLCLTCDVTKEELLFMAKCDICKKIKSIYTMYLSYHALETFLFKLNTQSDITDVLLSINANPVNLHDVKSFLSNEEKEFSKTIRLLPLNNYRIKPNEYFLYMNRMQDPITPLLSNWSYISLIHEFFSINNNSIKLADKDIVLSGREDDFYLENMFAHYPVLTKTTIDKFKAYQTEINRLKGLLMSNDIENIKEVSDSLYNFKKLSENIEKHINIQHAISLEIDSKIASSKDELNFLFNGKLSSQLTDKLKILYYLKHGKQIDGSLSDTVMGNLNKILKCWNKKLTKKKDYSEIDMYDPVIISMLNTAKKDYTSIIVFIEGGMTYAEAQIIDEFRKKYSLDIIIGSTEILNTNMYLEMLNK